MNLEKKYNTGIYQIVNLVNNKRYIGSAANFKQRKKDHFKNLKKNVHFNNYLQKAYNKYGKENFKFKVLLYCDKKDLLFYEQRALFSYIFKKDLYNICLTAGSRLNMRHSKKTKEKLSKINKGKKLSQETKKKIGDAQRGIPLSDETKRKMSISKKGHSVSKETREKLRIINLGEKSPKYGTHPSPETREKLSAWQFKPIKAFIYETGEYVGEFKSLKACAEELNILKSGISAVLCKKYKQTKGYTFKYINKEDGK